MSRASSYLLKSLSLYWYPPDSSAGAAAVRVPRICREIDFHKRGQQTEASVSSSVVPHCASPGSGRSA